jgi:hypothetical protein
MVIKYHQIITNKGRNMKHGYNKIKEELKSLQNEVASLKKEMLLNRMGENVYYGNFLLFFNKFNDTEDYIKSIRFFLKNTIDFVKEDCFVLSNGEETDLNGIEKDFSGNDKYAYRIYKENSDEVLMFLSIQKEYEKKHEKHEKQKKLERLYMASKKY